MTKTIWLATIAIGAVWQVLDVGAAEQATPPAAQQPVLSVRTASPAPSVTYVTTDTNTQGTWKGTYGADGYVVIGDTTNLPAYAQVAVTTKEGKLSDCGLYQYFEYTSAGSTTDVRALQKAQGTDRIAGAWFSYYLAVDVNFRDDQVHRIALYCLDWGNKYMAEKIEFLDPRTDAVLDTRKIKAFAKGEYLVWDIKGHVQLRVTSMAECRAAVSGLFFGGAQQVEAPK